MPRRSRIDAPGAAHHIIARAIERGKVFRDDQDRDFFLKRLGELIFETKTKCFAWALIPNHFHLLLQTGQVPIASFMRRLLSSYAIRHNLRHHRSGHLFQNRYKSILCQQDAYLKQLVRYIHLNPLRAGLVKDAEALDGYEYCGHSALMGKNDNNWQSVDEVLAFFGGKPAAARRSYRDFLVKGIALGRQPELVGGGLVRSVGGWSAVRSLRKAGIFQKSDERILGDGDFVEAVLADAQEVTDKRYALAARGVTFEHVMAAVSDLLSIQPEALVGPSKNRTFVKGRALLCCWVVRELGDSMTAVAERLKIAVPTVSVAVRKGEKIANDEHLVLSKLLNIKI